jgi:hypothetical protein
MSICLSSWIEHSGPTGRISIQSDFEYFFQSRSIKFNCHYNVTRKTGTLREDLFTFMIKYLAELFSE